MKMGTEPCVCGHESGEHRDGVGACDNPCGCSYVLPDSGVEPFAPTPDTRPYTGRYGRRYTL